MENKAPSILIIEDDNRNIFALSLVLKSKGYGCLAATSAKEGMALLVDFPGLAIVLLDMMIPEVDGYEAIDLLRKVPGRESLPIIAVTAQAMPGDEEKCLAAGANAYVSKPIDVDLLLGLLLGFLKQNLS
ncbi:response regulator [Arachidicoccus ginsenosidivorans]|uniref:Response regulator n=1 Tax=Arachidicoccus ginsenosidivorans TaxID=496057 RepID=A0A5B8VQQ4_9BACT|nr:response regulator [Arachidicoccus ginsenosidivorans]QEC73984.1 response regulator [Arachidicoccus ginsenosidivorans]